MEMKDRIKKLRKEKRLTQQEFADKIGISRNNVATYEIGRNSPSVAVISLICRTFQVNEVWLRTGEGEMFLPKSEDLILENPSLDMFDKILIRAYIDAPLELRAYLKEIVEKLASSISTNQNEPIETEFSIYQKIKKLKDSELQKSQEVNEQEILSDVDGIAPEILAQIEKDALQYKQHLIQEARTAISPVSSSINLKRVK